MGVLTGGETTLMIVAIVAGIVVFAATVAGIVMMFKKIERADKAEEEKFAEQPTDAER